MFYLCTRAHFGEYLELWKVLATCLKWRLRQLARLGAGTVVVLARWWKGMGTGRFLWDLPDM